MKKFLEFERIQRNVDELKNCMIKNKITVDGLLLNTSTSEIAYKKGDYFGEKNQYYTLSGKLVIPDNFKSNHLELAAFSSLTETDNSTNPQIKVYFDNKLVQGLDVNHHTLRLTNEQIQRKEIELRIEIFSGREEKKFPITVELREIDELTYDCFYDLYVLLDSWRSLEESDSNYFYYEKELGRAINFLNFLQPYGEDYYYGLNKVRKLLKEKFYSLVEKRAPKVFAVGHTHIDLAWLWTLAQAVEKGERSYSTIIKFMEEYEDLTFIQSQPQMYQLIKEQYPELYQLIKQKIAEGRWIAEGAMWVEADCNLASGESLVRQFLYGKRFFKEEFNKDSQVLWLPDVFGYSAALPQILKKTNTPYFMTTKLSWNQFNQIPYDSFYWQGIDGSRVLTHFITTVSEGYSPTPHYTTYNGMLDPFTIKGSWKRYQEKDVNDSILIAYGYGDGGGGPTKEMLETLKRMKNGLPSMPRVIESDAIDFFEELSNNMKEYPEKEWLGELYFEYHRGTYTSIAKNKKNNRYSETLLQTVEKLYSLLDNQKYPKRELEVAWKNVLLNQFHDILPGSSIKEVYDQTDEEYGKIIHKLNQLIHNILVPTNGKHLYVFSPIYSTSQVLEVPLKDNEILISNQESILTQKTYENKVIAKIPDAQIGGNYFTVSKTTEIVEPFIKTELTETFETEDFYVVFDNDYQMVKVIDKKNQRELTQKGQIVNKLLVYEDLPLNFDAWDIDYFYKEKPYVVSEVISAEIIERGVIRDTLKIIRKFYNSRITQFIHFVHGESRIDFETEVDWHQKHCLLRAEFPVPVNAYHATYDIQFGNVQRPVHKNTSWDKARFEVCGHKWLDLSDESYGVSLITDSKYGFDTHYQRMGVSLIKSATDPYEEADQGKHKFVYSIYCHSENWKSAMVHQKAMTFNTPSIAIRQSEKGLFEGEWVNCTEENVWIDTIKQAEDDQSLILRAYEFHNKKTIAKFHFAKKIESIELCDLMENPITKIVATDGEIVELNFDPYEIQTLKIKFMDVNNG